MSSSLKQLRYEVIFEALQGEVESGDQYLIKELPDATLLAVVDGLGHGEEAAFAAKKITQLLDAHANEPIKTLFELSNQALLDDRGVAMTIVKIDSGYRLSYIGIGNVMGVCWKIDENHKISHQSLFLQGGIVGTRLPSIIQTNEIVMAAGGTLILATDGIKNEFENEPPKLESPDKIAKHIFNTYRNNKDDGLILVAQLL